MCVKTTARMGGNLGYEVSDPLDATRTFDLAGPTIAGGGALTATAEELMRTTAINLHGGHFATVTTTKELLHRVQHTAGGGAGRKSADALLTSGPDGTL